MIGKDVPTTLKAKNPRVLYVVGEVEESTGSMLQLRVPYGDAPARALSMDELLNDCPNLSVLILQSPTTSETTRTTSTQVAASLMRVFAGEVAQSVPLVLVLPPMSAKLAQTVVALCARPILGLLWQRPFVLVRALDALLARTQMDRVLEGIGKARAEIYDAFKSGQLEMSRADDALNTALDVCVYSHAHLLDPRRSRTNLE